MISNEEKLLNQVKHSSVPNMRTHTSERGFILRPLEKKRTIPISLAVVSPPKMIQRTIELETQVNDIQISDDSLLLAAACNDRTVKLYDAKGGELEHTLTGCIEHVSSVALSPTLIVAGSSSAYVWSLDNKRLRHTMTGHSKHIYAIGIADARIITGSCDRTIKIWELNQGTCLKTLTEAKSIVNDLAISHFSSTFTTVHYDSFIRCFDLRAYNMIKEEKIHEGQVTSIDISRDDLYTLTCGKDSLCRVWDNRVGFGKVLYQLSHDDFRVSVNTTKAVFSPCGSYVASGSNNGHVFVWHLIKSVPVVSQLKGHKIASTCCAWSNDGAQVVSTGIDRKIVTYYSGPS